jgi:hypothetical protein
MNNKMKAVQITGKHAHRESTSEKLVQMRILYLKDWNDEPEWGGVNGSR